MIAIVDYGVGNLFSLQSSLSAIGAEAIVTADPDMLRQADKILLPGVGAFEDAASKLRETGLADLITALAKGGAPLLGIAKPVIKAHGSSDPEATVSAIRQAYKYVQAGILEEITEKAPILAAFKSEKKEQPEG